jgi:AcrR family transcriptional regulator
MATAHERIGKGRRDKPRKGDLREQAILDTAERLLGEIGVDAMTVEDIARGAGLSRGSLYFYYGSKQEVLTALIARTMTVLRVDAEAAAEDLEHEPEETIRRSMQTTERMWREHGHVMRAAVELSPTVPDVNTLWTETVDLYVRSITSILERAGLPKGNGPTDAAGLAHVLCWATERNFYLASAPPLRPQRLRRATAAMTEVWHRVIAGGPGR